MSFEQRMSKRIWGLDWAAVLPWSFDGGATVEYGTFAEAEPFLREVHPQTFNTDAQWLVEPMTEMKRRFAAEMDVFMFRFEGKVVGVITGHPSDWSTYYCRSTVLHPDQRSGRILSDFIERTYSLLRGVGVERIEADTSPGNPVTMRFFPSQGFTVTGSLTTERWGLLVRFTKYLGEESGRVYRRQFLDIPKQGKKERSSP